MLLFSGGNCELSAGAPVCTNYKPWQELMVNLTCNCIYAGKKVTERREGRNLHHLLKSRTIGRSAWAQEAESIETGDCNTRSWSLAWATVCPCAGYSV